MEHPDRTKQFDVPYVDGALLSILVPRVHGYLRDCSVHLPFLQHLPAAVSSLIPSVLLDDADINGLIQLSLSAVMAFVTIGRGVGTLGMNSLGLGMQQQQHQQQQHPAHASARDPRIDRLRRVATYVVLSGLLPTLYRMARKRWEDERMNGDDMSYEVQGRQSTGASRVEMLARHRRRKLRDGVMTFVAFVVPPARLVNHLCFILGSGGSASISSSSSSTGASSAIPPTLPMRIAGLSYATQKSGYQHINYAYAYRRVLYEQMFAIAQIMAPSARQLAAVPGSVASVATRLRRKAQIYVQQILKGGGGSNGCFGDGQSDATGDRDSRRACSICHAYPITTPYASSIGRDVYCYYCIRFALLDKEDYHRSQAYRRSS